MTSAVDRADLVNVALGIVPPDLVISGGNLVNVGTKEMYKADIIIKGQRIAAVVVEGYSGWAACETIHADGKFLAPGFIDPHVHIESSAVTVTEFAKAVLPRGVTTVAADPHEIANVLGLEGVRLFIEEAKGLPLNLLLRVPGRVPANPSHVETSGGEITFEQTVDMLGREDAVCLAGDINPNLILNSDPEQGAKISQAIRLGKTISGQSPGLSGAALNAFVAFGVEDSHVSKDVEEILDIARHGLRPLITHRNVLFSTDDYPKLVRVIREKNLDTRMMCFATDDTAPNILLKQGHLDQRVRLVIAAGLDPLTAFQMATCNTADHLRIRRDYGELSPGKFADILILEDLHAVKVDSVISHGKLVAMQGRLVSRPARFSYPPWSKRTVNVGRTLVAEDFQIRARKAEGSVKARIIHPDEREREVIQSLPVSKHVVLPKPEDNVACVAVIDRHRGSASVAKGFVTGYGLQRGAVASSVNHDAHNIIVIGASFRDMAIATARLIEIGGGHVAVQGGEVLVEVRLPIAGLISEHPLGDVAEEFEQFEHTLHSRLGWRPKGHPLQELTFLCLPNIHRITITDRGLFDTTTMKPVDVLID